MDSNPIDTQKLIEYLSNFATPERVQRFEEVIQNRTRHLTVVLEDLYQSHNTSAVLRSCDCFGIQDVHIIENSNSYKLNPEIALGASKWLNVHQYNEKEHNTLNCIKSLKAKGYKIAATSLHTQSIDLRDLDISDKTALLFGTEKEGLSTIALDEADVHVKIPMYGFTESFNISVSAALCLFYLTEKIHTSSILWGLSSEEKREVLATWLQSSIKDGEKLSKKFLSAR